MANPVKPKRSYTTTNTPTLEAGELGLNATDGKIWIGNAAGNANVLVVSKNFSDLVGKVSNTQIANSAVANLSGTNTGDNTVATALTGSPSITVTSIELGHATDTTISRVSAGVIAIEGVTLVGNVNHTGDATGSTALTLVTVATAGVTGSSTAIPVITLNAKGLTTSITTVAVIAPAGTLSGATLSSNVTASSLTSVGILKGLSVIGTITGSISGNAATATNQSGVNTGDNSANSSSTFIGTTSVALNRTSAALTLSGITLVTPNLGVASATSLATSAASPLLLTNGKLITVALASQTIGDATLTIKDLAGTSRILAFTSDVTGLNSGTNTGDQTITLTGGVSGTGTSSFVTTVLINANLTGVVTSIGNATSIASGVISNSMLANSSVANLSGTNTGDHSTNNLYSGIISNATHTGDATGSTSLKVIGINNVLMSGLLTGILKNTTGTGVPSIASASDFPPLNQNTTGSSASCSGNSATVTTNANLTGGVTSVGNAATVITNANLTGGVISSGNATTVVTNANLTGGVTSVGNAATVITNANLTGEATSSGNVTTLSNAAVISKLLTGYVSGSGTISALDSILTAIQKLNGNALISTLAIPTGSLLPYAGSSAPTGYLLCNGASVSRTTYAALFAITGTAYGSVDGNTFNLPDMRARVPLGAGASSGLTTRTLGGLVGSQSRILLESNLPPHAHALSGNTNAESAHTHSSPNAGNHEHTGTNGWRPLVFISSGGGANLNPGTTFNHYSMAQIMDHAGDHNHGTTNYNSGHSHSLTGSTQAGSGTSVGVDLTQPSTVVNYIIKT